MRRGAIPYHRPVLLRYIRMVGGRQGVEKNFFFYIFDRLKFALISHGWDVMLTKL